RRLHGAVEERELRRNVAASLRGEDSAPDVLRAAEDRRRELPRFVSRRPLRDGPRAVINRTVVDEKVQHLRAAHERGDDQEEDDADPSAASADCERETRARTAAAEVPHVAAFSELSPAHRTSPSRTGCPAARVGPGEVLAPASPRRYAVPSFAARPSSRRELKLISRKSKSSSTSSGIAKS